MDRAGLRCGAGAGVRMAYFGVYARARVEGNDAGVWPSAIAGAEMRIAHHLVLGGAVGWFRGFLYQAQLRYFFDVPT